jgi:hypothetical protein
LRHALDDGPMERQLEERRPIEYAAQAVAVGVALALVVPGVAVVGDGGVEVSALECERRLAAITSVAIGVVEAVCRNASTHAEALAASAGGAVAGAVALIE